MHSVFLFGITSGKIEKGLGMHLRFQHYFEEQKVCTSDFRCFPINYLNMIEIFYTEDVEYFIGKNETLVL